MSGDRVDDISDTVFTSVAGDRWLKLHNAILEVNLDIEDRGKIVCLVVLDVDLLSEIVHRRIDTLSDSFNNVTINVAEVSWPL